MNLLTFRTKYLTLLFVDNYKVSDTLTKNNQATITFVGGEVLYVTFEEKVAYFQFIVSNDSWLSVATLYDTYFDAYQIIAEAIDDFRKTLNSCLGGK